MTKNTDLKTVGKVENEMQESTVENKETREIISENGFKWLTDHSRNFLSAGYISPDTRAETRIKEIADRAEELLGIKGYSEKFYHYMSEGFFSLASPVWSNFGKKRGHQLFLPYLLSHMHLNIHHFLLS